MADALNLELHNALREAGASDKASRTAARSMAKLSGRTDKALIWIKALTVTAGVLAAINVAALNQLFVLTAEATANKSSIVTLTGDVGVLKEDVGVLKEDVGVLKEDVGVLREDVGVLREDVGVLKEDVGKLKEDVARLGERVKGLEEGQREIINLLQDRLSKSADDDPAVAPETSRVPQAPRSGNSHVDSVDSAPEISAAPRTPDP